jgi:molecular chaperone IbpA
VVRRQHLSVASHRLQDC